MSGLLRVVRHGPDRLLHSVRRRRAGAALRLVPVHSLLVVCHGNICRSPYAAAVLGKLLGPQHIVVTSAGFMGPNRPVPQMALEAAIARGIDLTTHRSRLLTPELMRAAELVVVMDMRQRDAVDKFAPHAVILGDLDPDPIAKRSIRDPWRLPPDVFDEVYSRIDRCAAALATALRQ
jgi:protein-tyrosine phosphatase